MTERWPEHTVQELQAMGVLRVEDGNHGNDRPRPGEFVREGTCFIRAADMEGGRVLFEQASRINDPALRRIRKGIGRPGDILLSHKGTVGKLAITPRTCEPFVCSPQTTFWRVEDERRLSRGFLYAFMRSRAFSRQLDAVKGETDMADYVSLTAQRRLRIPLPPMAVQQQISEILGGLDDKIDLNRRMNETLEAMVRTIFKDWFIDFGPTHAKIKGRAPYLASEIWSWFPDRLDEEGKPEGWRTLPLADVATLSRASVDPQGRADDAFVHFSIPAYDAGKRPVTERGRSIKSNKFVVPSDAILLSRLNPEIQRVWLVDSSYVDPAICSTEFMVFVPKARVSRAWLYALLSHESLSRRLCELATGTSKSHQRVAPMDVLKLSVDAGNDQVVEAFDRFANPILQRCATNERECQTLSALRDLLLPKLISGEIRIKDAERIAESVL